MTARKKRIGFISTLPVEIIYAAGHTPVDLNNLFISQNPQDKISKAEQEGFPRTVCSWVKGIYSAVLEHGLDEVIGVAQGDCSNTLSLLSILNEQSIKGSSFNFPIERDYLALANEIKRFEEYFETSHSEVMKSKSRLDQIRKKLFKLDELTWKHNLVTGAENHYWLVSATDFFGDPDLYEEKLELFIAEVEKRKPYKPALRLAYLGVPPIFHDLYEVISSLGGEVVFNEMQRQFAMLTIEEDIVQQYLVYTYPYSVYGRIRDVQEACSLRNIEAVISYTQAFCHMQIDNILLKKHLKIPFLTLEGDQPGEIDNRTLLRLESFMEIHGR